VETPEQLEFARKEGCNEYQGYLYSKPLPPAELERRLAASQG
jgi:EAL domain-containing protein (putative c-di-GMP-specific phosphodiesterase class I)